MDQELIAYIDAHFEQIKDELRQTRIELKGLREELDLFARGMISLDDRLDHFHRDVALKIEAEVKRLDDLSYSPLECRVRGLETWRETKERDPVEVIRERLRNGTL